LPPIETGRIVSNHRSRHVVPAGLVAILACGLLLAPAQAGAAFNPGAGGVLYACVKVKGKHKGTMKLVGAKKKCKHGQRKLAWNVTGAAGTPGANGTSGGSGSPGSSGPTNSTLQSEIDTLTQKLTSLESTVTSLASTVTGLQTTTTSLCTQLSTVTTQSDALRTVIAGLGVNNALTLLGGALSIPALPAALGPYTCP
jgi:hypothetical protein